MQYNQIRGQKEKLMYAHYTTCISETFTTTSAKLYVKGRFLELRMYHNFANLFSKLLESTFLQAYKLVSVLD